MSSDSYLHSFLKMETPESATIKWFIRYKIKKDDFLDNNLDPLIFFKISVWKQVEINRYALFYCCVVINVIL